MQPGKQDQQYTAAALNNHRGIQFGIMFAFGAFVSFMGGDQKDNADDGMYDKKNYHQKGHDDRTPGNEASGQHPCRQRYGMIKKQDRGNQT